MVSRKNYTKTVFRNVALSFNSQIQEQFSVKPGK